MLSVIGSVNFAPGLVEQSWVFHAPLWQAHELIVTTTVLNWPAGSVSLISLPNSDVC